MMGRNGDAFFCHECDAVFGSSWTKLCYDPRMNIERPPMYDLHVPFSPTTFGIRIFSSRRVER